jgi:hypothetical protein
VLIMLAPGTRADRKQDSPLSQQQSHLEAQLERPRDQSPVTGRCVCTTRFALVISGEYRRG